MGLDKNFDNVDVYFESLESQGNIPSGMFGAGIIDKIKARTELIKSELDCLFPAKKYECETIELNECIADSDGLEFILQGNIPLVFSSKGKYIIVDVSNSDGLGIYKYLNSYIGALGLIAARKATKVDLFIATGEIQDESEYEAVSCRIDMLSDDAKEVLCDMYKNAFIDLNHKILPISLLSSDIKNHEELKAELEDDRNGPWAYFAGKDLFINELEKYSGYPKDNFAEKWDKACKKQKELLGNLTSLLVGV